MPMSREVPRKNCLLMNRDVTGGMHRNMYSVLASMDTVGQVSTRSGNTQRLRKARGVWMLTSDV